MQATSFQCLKHALFSERIQGWGDKSTHTNSKERARLLKDAPAESEMQLRVEVTQFFYMVMPHYFGWAHTENSLTVCENENCPRTFRV
jgi:hypothetical protein